MDQGVRERAADLDEACESTRTSGEKTVTLEKIKEWRYSGQNTLDVFMKRIVLLVGGVETLAYFSIQMGNEWKRMAIRCSILTWRMR